MAFSLLTTVVCLIGLKYLYWVVLGAWRASRRSLNQPWSTLNIVQPTGSGLAAQTDDPTMRETAWNSRYNGGPGLDSSNNQSQGLGPPTVENGWPPLTSPGEEGSYGQEPGLPKTFNHYNPDRPQGFVAPTFQRRDFGPLRVASHPRGIPLPRRRNRLTYLRGEKDAQQAYVYAKSLPQHLGGMNLGPSLWRSHMEGRDADGDVDMMGKSWRFH